MASKEARTYEVLYFKRKNKVHKSKGVSKVDGRLVTHDGFVQLYEGDTTKQPIHTSKNADIANSDFQVDDHISLGQYSVEIVAVVSRGTGATVTTKVAAAKQLPAATSTLPRRALLTMNGIPPVKKQKTLITKTAPSGWQLNRRPPAQPKTAAVIDFSDDKEDTRDVKPQHRTATLPKRPLTKNSSTRNTLLSGHERKHPMAPPPPSATTLPPTSTPLIPSLPGAIGTLTLPQSIRTVMRPHQQTGVVYLWNCLTGSSPHLKRIAKQAGLEIIPKGAILADSMGMGTLHMLAHV